MAKPLAVIVGAGPGIGLAVARRFALGGFAVAVVSRPADPLAAFQAALEAPGPGAEPGPALVLAADLAQEEPLREALAAIAAWGGSPEVLVYNASAGAQGPAADLDPARLLAGFRVSAGAALACAQWALPAMRAAARGTLLFTGGGLALEPKPGLAAASLGKAALRSLALSLAGELAPEGIHAATVTICGFVQPGTPFSPERVAQAFWELHLQKRDGWERERTLR
jgi:NAD(P)-dependent dehydrogenase (short-subunit alcohol dehydrogenase family)